MLGPATTLDALGTAMYLSPLKEHEVRLLDTKVQAQIHGFRHRVFSNPALFELVQQKLAQQWQALEDKRSGTHAAGRVETVRSATCPAAAPLTAGTAAALPASAAIAAEHPFACTGEDRTRVRGDERRQHSVQQPSCAHPATTAPGAAARTNLVFIINIHAVIIGGAGKASAA